MSPAEKKAVRLVLENRVRLQYVTGDVQAGTVWGDHGVYSVTVDPSGVWCSCPYGGLRGGRHSHTIAVELAVAADDMVLV